MDDLYREAILDHYKHPRNFGALDQKCAWAEMDNPFCGDRIRMEVELARDKHMITIKKVAFSGVGCAISIASASMLTESLKDMKIQDLRRITKNDIVDMLQIPLTPVRIKCALLPLEVLQQAIKKYYHGRYKNHHNI